MHAVLGPTTAPGSALVLVDPHGAEVLDSKTKLYQAFVDSATRALDKDGLAARIWNFCRKLESPFLMPDLPESMPQGQRLLRWE